MHARFPEGTSLRYRSSTNNEDLPGFNGAGLYDSKTQHPEESIEDGVSKSLKQVYASLWNYRAFTEREFYRIDHRATAMGVLVHPNYSDEKINGVAVSVDPAYGTVGSYYVNSQVGEDLVTNPEANSVPEEILFLHDDTYRVVGVSNQVPAGQILMNDDQLTQLRSHLSTIHRRFAQLYRPSADEQFAIEIEFKITSADVLAIKQARPWIFAQSSGSSLPPGTQGALVGTFYALPKTHSGTLFNIRVRFDGNLQNSYRDLRDYGAVVTGGTVQAARRVVSGRSNAWEFGIEPDSDESVTFTLFPNRPCTVPGAICTLEGRRLSVKLQHTVCGPSGSDTPGTLTLSHVSPRIGVQLTANLSDQDGGVADQEWTWWRSGDRASWTRIAAAERATYSPVDADLNRWLQARVTYTDANCPGKMRAAETSNAVSSSSPTATKQTADRGGGGGGGSGSAESTAVVIVANGWSPPDIGVAAALAARTPNAVVLYTAEDRLSVGTRDLLREYQPAAVIVIGGNGAVSKEALASAQSALGSDSLQRIAGVSRADTAANVARAILGAVDAGAATLIVANGWSPPDIGVAAALSARIPRSAVAYTQSGGLPRPTAQLLDEFRPARVIIVGGTTAVLPAVESGIAAAAPGAVVERVSGATRVGTAASVARRFLGPAEAAATDDLTIIVANGWSSPDTGLAAALSARTPGSAVLYTEAGRLSYDTAAVLRDYQPAQVVFVGGTAALSPATQQHASEIVPDATTPRYSGATRTQTATAVARRILSRP